MKLTTLCSIALLLGLAAAPATAGIVVSVSPAFQAVDLSAGTATIDIVASIPQADAVIGWGLDLGLLGTSVSIAPGGVAIGPPFNSAFAPDGDELAGLAFPNAVFGPAVLLATITLDLNALGITDLLLSDSYPADLTEGFAKMSGFAQVSYVPGQIEVTPEPATLLLLTLGGLALIRRR